MAAKIIKGNDSQFEAFEVAVKKALKEYQRNNETLKSTDNKVQLSFLELGKKLANAGEALTRKTFKRLKDETAKELGKNGIRNIDKVVSVAKASHLDKYLFRLPAGWGTLALLTALKPEQLDTLMQDESITPEISRAELNAKIKLLKNPVVKVKQLTIKRLDNGEVTQEDREMLVKFLHNKGWGIHVSVSKVI